MNSRLRIALITLVAFFVLATVQLLVEISQAPYVVPILGALGVAAFCAYRCARSPRGERLAWALLTLAMALNAGGDIIFEVLSYLEGEVVSVSIADVLYLATYPMLFAGIVMMLRRRSEGGVRDALVDGVTVAIAAGIAIWQYFIVNPGVTESGTLLERWVYASYPLMDTLVIAALVGLVLAPGRRGRTELLVSGYLVTVLVADIFYAAMASAEAFQFEALSSAMFTASYGFLAAAGAGASDEAARPVSARTIRYSRLLLLGGALVVTPIVAVLSSEAGFTVQSSIYVGATLAITAIVIARMASLVDRLEREQNRLLVSEANLAHEATHDSLTGLPNRTFLLGRVNEEIAAGRESLALLFLDLDDFKVVNDSLGHHAGDELLKTVGERISAELRGGDIVARLGGDEFVVACFDIVDVAHAVQIAERVLQGVTGPARLSLGNAFARTSIGVALLNGHDDAGALLRDADIALYRAKALGGRRLAVFDDAMLMWASERHDLETSLREAVGDQRELHLVYQPRVDMRTGAVVGVEALARWQREDGTDVPPDVFIPIAESTGTIDAVGEWVLGNACRDIVALNAHRGPSQELMLSVNLSAHQLSRPALVDETLAILTSTGLRPTLLTLELIETSLAADPEAATRTLSALREHGIRVEIDDFGVGYSSLSYLSTYPVDGVKIDRSFVTEVADDPAAASVVSAVVALADALELDVTAEGVETRDQASKLRELGCAWAQGFYFAEPVEVSELRRQLDRTNATVGVPGS